MFRKNDNNIALVREHQGGQGRGVKGLVRTLRAPRLPVGQGRPAPRVVGGAQLGTPPVLTGFAAQLRYAVQGEPVKHHVLHRRFLSGPSEPCEEGSR